MALSKTLANARFNKKINLKVRTYFSQPAKKLRRRQRRAERCRKLGPNPTHSLRPAVRGMSRRYNNKIRLGRGFTVAELKLAGIKGVNYARSIGISIDKRRRDTCSETQKVNAERIKEYINKMILYPRKKADKKPQIKEATEDQLKSAEAQSQNTTRTVIPLPTLESGVSWSNISAEMKELKVYKTLRTEWKHQSGFYKKLEKRKEKKK